MKKIITSTLALPLIAGMSLVVVASTGNAAHIKDKMNCLHTWKAYKAQFRADHKGRGEFMRECRAGTLPSLAKGTSTQ